MMAGLNEFCKTGYEGNKERGFDVANENIGQSLMLVVSELAEALEAHRCGKYNYILRHETQPDDFEIWKTNLNNLILKIAQ